MKKEHEISGNFREKNTNVSKFCDLVKKEQEIVEERTQISVNFMEFQGK